MSHSAMMERAIEAYDRSSNPVGIEDITNSDAYFEAMEKAAQWFVDWYDENEAQETQTEDDMEAEQASAQEFAERWIDHVEQGHDIDATNRSLNRASNFI